MEPSLICLIDDDEVYQFIFQRQIELCNLPHKVLIFPNGQKCLDYLYQTQQTPAQLPECIFVDINMPIMDGWQFLDKFAAFRTQLSKAIKIYFVTSSIDERDMSKAQNIKEVEEYLIKPISDRKITDVLKKTQ
jgi:CheY-like chemotaxis protein